MEFVDRLLGVLQGFACLVATLVNRLDGRERGQLVFQPGSLPG
ncbi:hypothetical protein ACFCYC_07965 [Streptomyces sp. NPDC056402]